MIIRFGFVANSLSLWDVTPSKTVTFTRFQKLPVQERMDKLLSVTGHNLDHTLRILYFIVAHGIEIYRFSSALVPLATHPEVLWDFITPFRFKWQEIGDFVKKHRLRVSFHPSQFTLFTSPKQTVTKNAVQNMKYHYKMLEAMGIADEARMNIHIGGTYGDKESAIQQFYNNMKQLPDSVKQRMTLENDDKTYNAMETIEVCEKVGIPFVFDYHHYMANTGGYSIEEILPYVFDMWKNDAFPPMLHLSSPKSEKQYRAHADYLDIEFIKPLLSLLKDFGEDVDIMIEAKAKDLALLKLVEDLSRIRGVKRIRGGAIQL
ncbi:UV-damage endonuclease [Bacillus oleivorans]|uniref:UV DNA damage endonuclease n=1 Tax=Bacillus oleivorans TaxID=1448271 RepID=A0A285CIV1_9BACI|nr:UV DNA damage repair endonuclease UvsE [Bacillus oleivorans]SNX66926.1 UV-damage endonuclease [Bacillus oleivorans]